MNSIISFHFALFRHNLVKSRFFMALKVFRRWCLVLRSNVCFSWVIGAEKIIHLYFSEIVSKLFDMAKRDRPESPLISCAQESLPKFHLETFVQKDRLKSLISTVCLIEIDVTNNLELTRFYTLFVFVYERIGRTPTDVVLWVKILGLSRIVHRAYEQRSIGQEMSKYAIL